MTKKTQALNLDETKNYFLAEIKHNELISKKQKKIFVTSNYNEHWLILTSAATECVSISGFGFLAGIPKGITSSGVGLKFCAITA